MRTGDAVDNEKEKDKWLCRLASRNRCCIAFVADHWHQFPDPNSFKWFSRLYRGVLGTIPADAGVGGLSAVLPGDVRGSVQLL